MRKGMALGLAGIVTASLAAGVALLGGRVDSAAASGPTEPTVVTEHRTVTVYKTQTLPQQTIVMAAPSSEDTEGDDVEETAEATPTASPSAQVSQAPGSGGYVDSDDHLGDGLGGGHDD